MTKYSQPLIKAMAKHLVTVEGRNDHRYQQFVTSLSNKTGASRGAVEFKIRKLAS